MKEKKGILKRVIEYGMTTIKSPDILVTSIGRFTTSHQTERRNPTGRVMPIKLETMNRATTFLRNIFFY